jgi:hypothetical protein
MNNLVEDRKKLETFFILINEKAPPGVRSGLYSGTPRAA